MRIVVFAERAFVSLLAPIDVRPIRAALFQQVMIFCLQLLLVKVFILSRAFLMSHHPLSRCPTTRHHRIANTPATKLLDHPTVLRRGKQALLANRNGAAVGLDVSLGQLILLNHCDTQRDE